MKGPTYVTFDGMAWPNPTDPLEVEWSLRYGSPTREQMLVAASVVAAYRQLVEDPPGRRNRKIAGLRQALAEPVREGEALGVTDEQLCCDLHGRNCEQGGEECCERCTEAHHFAPGHGGVPCSAPDLSAGWTLDNLERPRPVVDVDLPEMPEGSDRA